MSTVVIESSGGSPFSPEALMPQIGLDEKDILAERINSTDPTYTSLSKPEKEKKHKETKAKLADNSPALISIKQEIKAANAHAKTVSNNIPLCSNPITVAAAVTTILSVLPDLIEMLNNLGIIDKLPESLKLVIFGPLTILSTTVNSIIDPIKAINSLIQGIGGPENLIPLPPSFSIKIK